MALGPNSTPIREHVLKIAESKIDDAIRSQNFNSPDSVSISTSLLPRMNTREWSEIRSIYKAVGWSSVEVISDQRDGDFLRLSAKQPSYITNHGVRQMTVSEKNFYDLSTGRRIYDKDGDK